MTASPAGQALPTVVHVPLAGQADTGVQGVPLEVTEQPVMVVIPLPSAGWMGLPIMLVVLTMAGAVQLVMTPLT